MSKCQCVSAAHPHSCHTGCSGRCAEAGTSCRWSSTWASPPAGWWGLPWCEVEAGNSCSQCCLHTRGKQKKEKHSLLSDINLTCQMECFTFQLPERVYTRDFLQDFNVFKNTVSISCHCSWQPNFFHTYPKIHTFFNLIRPLEMIFSPLGQSYNSNKGSWSQEGLSLYHRKSQKGKKTKEFSSTYGGG